jgi:hypothetical protein
MRGGSAWHPYAWALARGLCFGCAIGLASHSGLVWWRTALLATLFGVWGMGFGERRS